MTISTAANTYSTQWNSAISRAPTTIIVARIARAPITPQKSTRCWWIGGTASDAKIIEITKMLSMLSDFSTT